MLSKETELIATGTVSQAESVRVRQSEHVLICAIGGMPLHVEGRILVLCLVPPSALSGSSASFGRHHPCALSLAVSAQAFVRGSAADWGCIM